MTDTRQTRTRPGDHVPTGIEATESPRMDRATLRKLSALGVSFVAFDHSGRRTLVSPVARTILGDDDCVSDNLWRLMWQVARRELERACDGRLPAASVVERITAGIGATAARGDGTDVDVACVVFLQPLHASRGDDRLRACGLTPREMEVARLIADGRLTKQIGSVLGISFHTARHHVEKVFSKLGVRGRVEVTRLVLGGEDRSAA